MLFRRQKIKKRHAHAHVSHDTFLSRYWIPRILSVCFGLACQRHYSIAHSDLVMLPMGAFAFAFFFCFFFFRSNVFVECLFS